ncbi:hypothetical protein Leryth_024610 [Lithospermum erythrorhizon]|nr:hypothetical protein Leryth_024610 [Lithospermum erythrorhizon]
MEVANNLTSILEGHGPHHECPLQWSVITTHCGKSTLCSYFRSSNKPCSHGDTCRFAHGEAELRARPDGSWDPTSERVKKDEDEEKGDVEDDDVMMTEAIDDDDDKWLVRRLGPLPMRWTADDLKDFLNDKLWFRTSPIDDVSDVCQTTPQYTYVNGDGTVPVESAKADKFEAVERAGVGATHKWTIEDERVFELIQSWLGGCTMAKSLEDPQK